MKVRITFIAEIDNQELLDSGVSLTDKEAIADYYYANGGEEEFHSYGEDFEVIG